MNAVIIESSMGLAVVPNLGPSEEQHAAIRGELARVLALPEFAGSKRCSDFLAYAVDRTLLGGAESELKERTIAVEVFGRSPEYDPNEDSIVRVTARDVRKRLAQCYLGIEACHPVRIELKTGSYRTEFHWPEPQPVLALSVPVQAERTLVVPRPARPWIRLAACSLALAAAFMAGWWMRPRSAPPLPQILQTFWAPVLQSPATVLMCVGTPTVYHTSDRLLRAHGLQPAFTPEQILGGADLVPVPGLYSGFGNVHTATDLVALMSRLGKPWQIRTARDVSFAELRMSPAILIGGESNVWTQPLTTELRFYFSADTQGMVIRDRTQPTIQWPVARSDQKTDDYAIVSRILNSKTDRPLIFLGGRSQSGTQAAGELVTQEGLLSKALATAPKDWARKNVQWVIRTHVHGLTPSSPEILAAHFW